MRINPACYKVLPRAGTLALALAMSACGSNGATEPDAANSSDARQDVVDGDAVDRPDALNPDSLRSGIVSVVDMAVTNPDVQASGATVSISYRDLSVPHVAPSYGAPDQPDHGDCSVWVYNVDQNFPRPVVDEGSVTIEGEGLLSPVGTCAYDDSLGAYRCVAGEGTVGTDSSASPSENGEVLLSFSSGAPPADLDVIGMYVELTGFQNPVYNGRFPIVGRPESSVLAIYNPAAMGQEPESVTDTEPVYKLLAGEGPTRAAADFLGDESQAITLTKQAGPVVAEFSGVLGASGQGLTLADDSALPHALPSTVQDVVFSCDPASNGNCGADGGAIVTLVLSGITTDADLTDAAPTEMPAAVTQYARFECRSLPGLATLSMPQAALQAVLGTTPTRIETRLSRVTIDLAKPQTTVMVGHGLVGYTDLPQ